MCAHVHAWACVFTLSPPFPPCPILHCSLLSSGFFFGGGLLFGGGRLWERVALLLQHRGASTGDVYY